MREIKFRAWNPSRNMMLSWDNIKFKKFLVNLEKDTADRLVFMQYTGQDDKDGVEIYEGDIVKKSNFDKHGYEVYWHLFTACWRLRHPHRSGFTGISKGDMALMCEVIGNIYENKELLNDA